MAWGNLSSVERARINYDLWLIRNRWKLARIRCELYGCDPKPHSEVTITDSRYAGSEKAWTWICRRCYSITWVKVMQND